MCTLRIGGTNLDVDALLRAVPLQAAAIHRKGEPRFSKKPEGRRNESSVVNVGVSNAEFSDLSGQVADAIAFLRDHAEELRTARLFDGVEHLVFDFAIEERDVFAQSDVFPAPLLALLGNLGIDLEVTRYPQ